MLDIEAKYSELFQAQQNSSATVKKKEMEFNEERKALLQNLADVTNKLEEMKFKYNEALIEKSDLEVQLEELKRFQDGTASSEKSGFDAKLQENLAVIENLETELNKSQDQLKYVEEKLFVSEERRVSLETKNEEMFRKITEDSQNLITIDDLANRVDALLKSEKDLLNSVKTLETGNAELKQLLTETQEEKHNLEREVKGLLEKSVETASEIEMLREMDVEKTELVNSLTKDLEKTKMENKRISAEFKKLNSDYEQFEIDFKESLENSQNLEKSLKHEIEELASVNAGLLEKLNMLSEDKNRNEEKAEDVAVSDEDKKKKKRKSITFRTDEVEYIKELKSQLHDYDANLKKANKEIENLKAKLNEEKIKEEMVREVSESRKMDPNKIPTPVIEPLIEKAEIKTISGQKSNEGERKFDANLFFGAPQNENFEENSFFTDAGKAPFDEPTQSCSDFESLVWDDSWGTDGQLEQEYLSSKMTESSAAQPKEDIVFEYKERIKTLESEMESSRKEIERLSNELQEQQGKYAKALKKLKEQRIVTEKLQKEIKQLKNNTSLEDLDAAIVDELKSQIESKEKKERELLKTIENYKTEKESLLKRIDSLNVKNLEMKERQDTGVEYWQQKNNELLSEISTLRQNLNENSLAKENKELLNKIEALERKLSNSSESKEISFSETSNTEPFAMDVQKVIEEKSALQKEIEELNNVKDLLQKKLFDEETRNSSAIGELNDQLNALATENETLQEILGEMKKTVEASKKEKEKEKKSNIFDYFKSSSNDDELFPVVPNEPTVQNEPVSKNDDGEIEELKKKLCELENVTKLKDEELNAKSHKISQLENSLREMDGLRQKIKDLDELVKMKENDVKEMSEKNFVKDKEVEEWREKLNLLQSQYENEIRNLKKDLEEAKNVLGLREEELSCLKNHLLEMDRQMMQRVEAEKVQRKESLNEFDTIDLNEKTETMPAEPQDHPEILKSKILELENLLHLKENELINLQLSISNQNDKKNEMDALVQKNIELENYLKMAEEELNQLRSLAWNKQETAELKGKVEELEKILRFKEEEFFHFEAGKNREIEGLNMSIRDLENMLKGKDVQMENLQKTISELENVAAMEKNNSESKEEVENLKQKIIELENLVSAKNGEINELMTKINELEKSYNDSKIEIERLLNEEKLNTEEKFVEPFQKNIQIPVAFELEAISRSLEEEKQKSGNLLYELAEKDKTIQEKMNEIQILTEKIMNLENRMKSFEDAENREKVKATSESLEMKAQLEKIIMDLQKELECINLEFGETKRELEKYQNSKDEDLTNLKSQILKLETESVESAKRKDSEILEIKNELMEKANLCESLLETNKENETNMMGKIAELENSKGIIEREFEKLQFEHARKENEILALTQTVNEERERLSQVTAILEEKELEVTDLKQTLTHLQEEIGHFRNFEKQVKELRIAQIQEDAKTEASGKYYVVSIFFCLLRVYVLLLTVRVIRSSHFGR